MCLTVRLFIILSFITLISCDQKVKISIFYGTLCPDSMRFIERQLQPTYKKLGNILEIEVIAYGKAYEIQTDGGYQFFCQHGQAECLGNMVVGCAKKYITDKKMFLDFTFCLMSSRNPSVAGPHCSKQFHIDYKNIDSCVNTNEGQHVLHNEGLLQKTQASLLNYVPWIIINDKYSTENRYAAERNLKKLVLSTYTGQLP